MVLRLAQVLDVGCPPELEAIIGVGVNINRYQHRVPDVAVVRADSMDSVFQERPPALVVEVASPRTRLYDRNRKKDVYEQFGIVSYWIVDPDRDKPELIVFELREGRYREVARVGGRGVRGGPAVPADGHAVGAGADQPLTWSGGGSAGHFGGGWRTR